MAPKFNTTILFAPLDWGLGHASRCVPLIQYFTNEGCKVILATGGMQKKMLLTEFPNHQYIELSGYGIHYTKRKRWFTVKIIFQIPKILKAIRHEHTWLKSVVKEYQINAVISDNRYGLWHSRIPSVFITHQLLIRTPLWVQKLAQQFNYGLINQFSACWIPDTAGEPNLAGKLSHPSQLPRVNTSYLGGLSRFTVSGQQTKAYQLLVVISGPEPQRSVFEMKLLLALKSYHKKALFVRGLPGVHSTIASFNSIKIVNHLSADELGSAFEQSDYIISRSGYTTVMDIIRLKKKSILVPTPGQTEQEYLAAHLKKQQWCYAMPQKNLIYKPRLKMPRLLLTAFPTWIWKHTNRFWALFLKACVVKGW